MKKYIFLVIFMIWMGVNFSKALDYDVDKVADAWIWRNNDLRDKLWLTEYTYDDRLDKTANEWSKYMANLWTRTHKRKSTDWFYNYNSLLDRFADRWLTFSNVNRTTFTENVWVGYVKCKEKDCTDQVITAIKSTRNWFMSEAKYGWAHYNSLVNKNFRLIWFWLYIDKKNKYYLTIHYATKIIDGKKTTDKSTTPKDVDLDKWVISNTDKTIIQVQKTTTKTEVNMSEVDKRPTSLVPKK